MTHRHYTYGWLRCRECGRIANDHGEYCDDCSDRLDAEAAAQEDADEDDEADCIPPSAKCTCRTPFVSSAALEPPEPILDRYCPVHGDGGPDPDAARDARLDQIRHDRDYPQSYDED